MGAEFYDVLVCQHSRKAECSRYKCRNYNCPHHNRYVPDTYVEFYEWNPFSKSAEVKCPYFRTKAQMIVQSNRGLVR